jgi:hypothetical protein
VDVQWLRDNWALAAGLAMLLSVAVLALLYAARSSGRGQLRHARRTLREKRKALRKATAALAAAERRCQRLQRRADKVKPRHLEEARGEAADARALAKIAHDQVLIAENHVRRIIVEEFPPTRQARLRARHRLDDKPQKKPFTF